MLVADLSIIAIVLVVQLAVLYATSQLNKLVRSRLSELKAMLEKSNAN